MMESVSRRSLFTAESWLVSSSSDELLTSFSDARTASTIAWPVEGSDIEE